MSDQNTNRDLESPDSNTVLFYLNLMRKWLGYGIDCFFGYDNGSQRKPAIILECGDQEVALDIKTAFLLHHALKQEPDLLETFLQDWLLARKDEPPLTSGSKMPKRKIARSCKAKAEPKTEVVYSIDDAVKKVLG
ncbi:MAG: hypothetical protein ACPGTQ_10180 [Colwellia sp.]